MFIKIFHPLQNKSISIIGDSCYNGKPMDTQISNNDKKINRKIDWLFFTACQPNKVYFMPRGHRIAIIVHIYLHFCEVAS